MIILKGDGNEEQKKYRVIDAHCHIYPQKIAAKAVTAIGNFYGIKMAEDGTADSLIRAGEAIGVEKYVVHSTATTVHQVRSINEYIYGEMQAHPEFIGFSTASHFSPSGILSMSLAFANAATNWSCSAFTLRPSSVRMSLPASSGKESGFFAFA